MSSEKVTLEISEDLSNLRADKALQKSQIVKSRSQAGKLIEAGSVTLKGMPIKASTILDRGDVLEIYLPAAPDKFPKPEESNLDIYYEDTRLIVINKPAGLVMHPGAGHIQGTLVSQLLSHCKQLSTGTAPDRPGIVHRLDKTTSGLIVIAKDDNCQHDLIRQFKSRTVKRNYWAIAYGCPRIKNTRLETQFGRHPVHRKKFAVLPPGQGKPAITNYDVLGAGKGLSWLDVRLETGRTHQIRVHLSWLGHPLVGDKIYGGANRHQKLSDRGLAEMIDNLDRVALHAYSLGFKHPSSGKMIELEAPWPDELVRLIETCEFTDV